ncbi:MAG: hypothetical protein GKS06_20395 [Acidobacteria bacterium]|nr:hypothetical protein [Acidobacteriota bacterium]
MKSPRLFALAAAAALAGTLGMTPVQLQVVNARQLPASDPSLPRVEPSLAVHPHNGSHLVVASMVWATEGPTVEVMSSFDAGSTWRSKLLAGCEFDPWTAVDDEGVAYVSCLSGRETLVFKSLDGGLIWGPPASLPMSSPHEVAPGEFDHTALVLRDAPLSGPSQVVVVGMQEVAVDGREYVAPFASFSRDGAVSFSAPARLLWNDLWTNTLNAIALPSGAMLVGIVDFSVGGRRRLDRLRVWTSEFSTPDNEFAPLTMVVEIAESSTIPVLVGQAGTTNAYVAFDDMRAGRSGIWLANSEDGGRQWNVPKPVVLGATGGPKSHFSAQGAVGPGGDLVVAWYELADSANRCLAVRAASSTDDGNSFSEPVDLAASPYCLGDSGASPPAGASPNARVARRWPYGGDYFGLASVGPGRFRVVWADASSGTFLLSSALLLTR